MTLHTVKEWARECAYAVAWGFVLLAITTSLAGAQSDNTVVKARVVLATDAAHSEAPLKLAVLAQVAPGFHINDHKPTLDYLIPTALKVEPNDQFKVKEVAYPKGTPEKFVFSDVPLSVYQGALTLGVLLQVGKVPAGTYTWKAKLAYQACNDHACLPPASVPLSVNIKVVNHNVSLKAVEPNVFQRITFEQR